MRRTLLHQLMVDRAARRRRAAGMGHAHRGNRGARRDQAARPTGAGPLDRGRGRQPFRRSPLGRAGRLRSRQPPLRFPPSLSRGPLERVHGDPLGRRAASSTSRPLRRGEVCAVLISRNQRLRLDDALPRFPEVARRLAAAGSATLERGGVSASRRLRRSSRGNVALVGDASGSVDAITGEGLCLLFQHAIAAARALEAGDLALYQEEHRRIGRRPDFMADFMLLLEHRRLRGRAIPALASQPRLFSELLAMHVGALSARAFLATTLAIGWEMLTS